MGATSRLPALPISHIATRTTSKTGDEALVCATMFGVSAGKIADVPPPERYRSLFRSNKYTPWRIIFLNQKRYEEYGSRWIPRSLAAEASPDFRPLAQAIGEQATYAIPPLWPRQVSDEGLAIRPTAFLFKENHQTLTASCKMNVDGIWYTAFIHAAGSSDALDPIPQGELALLTDNAIFNHPTSCIAVLVSVLSWASSLEDIMAQEVDRSLVLAPLRGAFRSTKAVLADATKCRHEALVDLTQLQGNHADLDLPELKMEADPSTTAATALPWRVG